MITVLQQFNSRVTNNIQIQPGLKVKLSIIFIVCSGKIIIESCHARKRLRQRERRQNSTFFCTFLCRCFVRQHKTSQLRVLWRECRTCFFFFFLLFFLLPLIFTLVAARISHFVTAATKFSCRSFNNKWLLISRSSSMLLFFSLSFAGLSPTFSFSLSFSCPIFQICGHDN